MSDEKADVAVNSIELATELTIAWLNNPNVTPSSEDALSFLRSMRGEIEGMANAAQTPAADAAPEYVPAVSIRSSVKPDHIVSLIDGKKYKSLKRHLSANGLTPAEYRQRYGLKPDYPMVAAEYSAARREVAKKLGLGRKGRGARSKAAPEPVAAPETIAPAKPARAVKAKPAAAAPAKTAPKAPAKAAAKVTAEETRSVKAKTAATPKPGKRAPAAKAKADTAPAKEAATGSKRGWWKKSAEAPADTAAAPAPAKRGRAKKAPTEA